MPDRRLDSWKEIARYLRRDVRTVIRWEQSRGLPVYRVPGGRLARVFAYEEELDQWLANRAPERDVETENETPDVPENHHNVDSIASHTSRQWRVPATAAIGTLIVVVATVLWLRASDARPPLRLTMVDNAVAAVDGAGTTQWTHRVETSDLTSKPALWSRVADFDDDGHSDLLASIELARDRSGQPAGELIRFSETGRVLWTARVTDRVVFRERTFAPPWTAGEAVVYRAQGATRIAWLVHHFTWWPGLLVTFNGRGERLGTFVNSGWIQYVVPSADGRYLFISGVTNSKAAYFVAVLDAANPTGHAPEALGSPTECVSCPAGAPLRYFVLPRTDISLAHPFPAGGPSLQAFDDGTVSVHAIESGGPNVAAAIYELSADLNIRHARFSDSFWEWHRQLEADGRLRHSIESCPERLGMHVDSWTSASGWQRERITIR